VWFCSGQVEHGFTVAKTEKKSFAGTITRKRKSQRRNYPLIRMYTTELNWRMNHRPIPKAMGVCSPETVGDMSAAAYFFGARESISKLKVPIGLVTSAYGAEHLPGVDEPGESLRPIRN